ncbi:hypothetical protein QIA30_05370 (plasmid) [Borreliella turdi]|uniref:hypothetical protein n=1 Tax=Borreliella turdi TaxID=57863 RepID=UPI003AF1320E
MGKFGNLSAIKDKYNNLIKNLAGLEYYFIIFFSPSYLKRFYFLAILIDRINDNNYKILDIEASINSIMTFKSKLKFLEDYGTKNIYIKK